MGSVGPAPRAERGGHDGEDRSCPHGVDGETIQAGVQPRLGAKPDGTSAEVGERRGVLDDRQEQPLLPFAL